MEGLCLARPFSWVGQERPLGVRRPVLESRLCGFWVLWPWKSPWPLRATVTMAAQGNKSLWQPTRQHSGITWCSVGRRSVNFHFLCGPGAGAGFLYRQQWSAGAWEPGRSDSLSLLFPSPLLGPPFAHSGVKLFEVAKAEDRPSYFKSQAD